MAVISVGEIQATLSLRDQLTPSLQLATQQLDKAGASFQRVGNRMKEAGSAMTLAVTVPLTAAATAALKFSADFESVMTRVGVLTDVGAENIGMMRESILAMSGDVGIGPEALAEGLLIVASTGIRGAEALDILQQSARASATGLGETTDVARAVTSAITAYGKENLTATESVNKLFVAVRAGGAEANEFAGTLGRVVGIASQIGVSFDEVLASMATFTRLGVDADEAATALRGTMSILLKPSQQARDQLDALGTSMEELRRQVREKGLAAALTDLIALAEGNEDALGEIIPNTRALSGIMGTAGAQAGAYAEALRDISGATDELDQAFEETSKTLRFSWNQVVAEGQRLLIQLGDAIAPVFRDVLAAARPLVDQLGELVTWFSALPQPVKAVTVALLGIAAAAGPVLYFFGTMVSGLGGLAIGAALLSSAFGKVSGDAILAAVGLGKVAGTAAASAVAVDVATLSNLKYAGSASTAAAAAGRLSAGLALTGNTQKLLASNLPVLARDLNTTGTAMTTVATTSGTLARTLGTVTGTAARLAPVLVGWPALIATAVAAMFTFTGTWDELGRIVKNIGVIIVNVASAFWDEFIVPVGKGLLDITSRVAGFVDSIFGISDGIGAIGAAWTYAWESADKFFADLAQRTTRAKADAEVLQERISGTAARIKELADEVGRIDATTDMRELTRLATELGEAGGLGAAELKKIGDAARQLRARGVELSPALENIIGGLDIMAENSVRAGRGLKTMTEQLAEAQRKMAALTAEQKADIAAGLALGKSVSDIADKTKIAADVVQLYSDALDKAKAATKAEKEALDDLAKARLRDQQQRLKDIQDAGLRDIQEAERIANEQIAGAENNMAIQTAIRQQAYEAWARMQDFNGERALQAAGEDYQRQIALAQEFGNQMGATLGRVPEILISAFTGGGGLGGAVKALGVGLGTDLWGAVLGKAGEMGAEGFKAGTGLLKSFDIGTQLGSFMSTALPAIGAAIGPAIQGLVKLFGDHAGKDMKRTGKEWGVSLSDGLLDQLRADAKKFGGEMQAMLINLDKIIGEAGGVAAFGIDKAIAKTRDLFVMVAQGSLTAQQVGGTFDRMFGQLLPESISKTTGLARREFLELIDLAREFGVESEAATKFLQDSVSQVAQGSNKIAAGFSSTLEAGFERVLKSGLGEKVGAKVGDDLFAALGDKAASSQIMKDAVREARARGVELGAIVTEVREKYQVEFDRVGRLATVAFASGIAGGQTFTQVLASIGPALDGLSEAQRKFGFETTGALGELLKFQQFAKDNEAVVASLDGVNQMMTGLHNIGMLTQETFNDLTATAAGTFQKMVDGGVDGRTALAAMQPTLQRVWELQQDFGYEVDETTQKLLDQAVEAGIVGDKQRDAQERAALAMERVVGVLELMAEHMGVLIPEKAREAAKSIEDEFSKVNPTVGVDVYYSHYNAEATVGHSGGYVSPQGIQVMHDGMDSVRRYHLGADEVPAILQTGEAVLNRRAAAMLGRPAIAALNRGGRGQRGSGTRDDSTAVLRTLVSGLRDELAQDRVTTRNALVAALKDVVRRS